MKTSIASILTAGAALLVGLHPTPTRADILYVANGGNNTIEKFTSGGVGSLFAGVPFATDQGLNGPVGLAFDSAANLYAVNNGNNTIEKFTPGGVGSLFASSGLNNAAGLALDSAGNLYVANAGDSTIQKFTPGGVRSVFASSGLNIPIGLAFDSAGNLYAANQSNNTIEKFTPGGVGSVFASTGLSGPSGLAFDSAGNLYVTNFTGAGWIEKFTPGGVGSLFASTASPAIGLAFDDAGSLYAAYQNANTIERFSATGTDLGAFASSGLNAPHFIAFTDNAGTPLKLANQAPEPSACALLALGLPALLAFRRRRNAQA